MSLHVWILGMRTIGEVPGNALNSIKIGRIEPQTR